MTEAAECREVRSSSKERSVSHRASTVENHLGKEGHQGSRGFSECCSGLLCDGSCGGSLSVTGRNAVEGLRLRDVRVPVSDVEGTNFLLGGFVRSFVLPDSLVSRDVNQLDCGNLTSLGVCKTETLLGI